MKDIQPSPDQNNQTPSQNQKHLRVHQIAATVAAFGATIGMGFQDVLAQPSPPLNPKSAPARPPSINKAKPMTPAEIDRMQNLRKDSQNIAPGLKKNPDILSFKVKEKDELTNKKTPSSTSR